MITGCARNHRFDPGQYLADEGDPANEFFLIRHGSVSLEIMPPGRSAMVIATEQEGDVVGISWLPGHRIAGSSMPAPGTGARGRIRRQVPARQMRGG